MQMGASPWQCVASVDAEESHDKEAHLPGWHVPAAGTVLATAWHCTRYDGCLYLANFLRKLKCPLFSPVSLRMQVICARAKRIICYCCYYLYFHKKGVLRLLQKVAVSC